MPDSAVLTVRELTERLRGLVEGRFPFVWVRGEVTDLSRPGSGHVYFTLKDGEAQLACVWFRQRQRDVESFDPLTGEVFEDGPRPSLAARLANGQQLCCAGAVRVYAPRGRYQLAVEFAQEAGRGQLAALFEELKGRLQARGFFAPERKRPLPDSPSRVAVITAPGGAAIHDFIRLASRRGCGAELRVYPALMQGEGAVPDIMRALARINAGDWAQVIVIIRGGGSLEDLWAFNDESLAEAVFLSRLPVLAGIGHEVDFTLVDLTADVRAATPSHAAQLLWPERESLALEVRALEGRLIRAMSARVSECARRCGEMERALGWCSPVRRMERHAESLHGLTASLAAAGRALLQRRELELCALEAALHARHPAARLAAAEERLAEMERRLHERGASALSGGERAWAEADAALRRAAAAVLDGGMRLHGELAARLAAADPDAPLRRGFALVRTPAGRLVRSAALAAPGSCLRVRLRDGELNVRVLDSSSGTAG
ncbi:MAG: exodeoxyribonuclease VII large subunit [Desulfovibrionaceae bacterium]|nr:exodeoxyribonuclease VII large subunit [Desulfovibrionaceae bacterium]